MNASSPALRLHFTAGPRTDEQVEVNTSPFLIGRDQGAHLFLDDSSVSRLHVALICRDGEWIIQDMGGLNPPRIHGRPAVSVPLQVGDLIQLGECAFRVECLGNSSVANLSDQIAEISAEKCEISPHRAQQLAGKPLWEVLHSMTELMHILEDGDQLLRQSLDAFMKVIPADRMGIYQKDMSSGVLRPLASRNFDEEDPIGFSETIVARSMKDRVAKLFAPESDPHTPPPRSRSMIRKRIRNALCLPVISAGEVWGVIYLDQVSTDKPHLLPVDLELGNLLVSWFAEAVEKSERFQEMDEEIVHLRKVKRRESQLIGESKQINETRRRVRKVAKSEVTVLITGESGTGKELVAKGIHKASDRKAGPFVAINCAAIPETLLESELFGYAKHSGIHGADPAGKKGRFEQASGGTLFLDEIGEMAPALQAKLLRVLEERVVDPIGGNTPIEVDVRVVTATNRDLLKEAEEGRFREDLYYRLRVFPIHLLPLRERADDILPLTQHLLSLQCDHEVSISPRALEMLRNYPWPGNVRELKNVLIEALLSGDGRKIAPKDIPSIAEPNTVPFQSLREIERIHILRVLDGVNWNKKKAAELLGIHRSTLYEKITEHELGDGQTR